MTTAGYRTGWSAVTPGVVPDVDDVIALADQCQYLIMATDDDRWSRGAQSIRDRLVERGANHAEIHIRPGRHDFPQAARTTAYDFLADTL